LESASEENRRDSEKPAGIVPARFRISCGDISQPLSARCGEMFGRRAEIGFSNAPRDAPRDAPREMKTKLGFEFKTDLGRFTS